MILFFLFFLFSIKVLTCSLDLLLKQNNIKLSQLHIMKIIVFFAVQSELITRQQRQDVILLSEAHGDVRH